MTQITYVADSTTNRMAVDSSGNAQLTLGTALDSAIDSISVEGRKATYSAVTAGFALANQPIEFFGLKGSTTKVVRVRRIGFMVTSATEPVLLVMNVAKYSTFPTTAFSVAATAVPHDSANAAATAAAGHWTANPTGGTSAGNLRIGNFFIPDSTALADGGLVPGWVFHHEWAFGDKDGQSIVLRADTQGVILTYGNQSAVPDDAVAACYAEWTEE